jgi:lysylphosphatidylglycerol synthetase-like protein (DUF2156 family)
MNKIIGALLGISGIGLGIWLFIHGIVLIVDGATASPVASHTLIWGIIWVCFLAELVGGLITMVGALVFIGRKG